MRKIDELMEKLPPDLRKEVCDFAQFLLETKPKPKQTRLRMSWAGGLSEFRDKFTSLELQKKSLEWWSE